MAEKKTTIHDIARKLNTTASTVSRALNNNPRISEATRKAVLAAAEELNYRPNSIASALRHGRSQIIGILVPTANRTFFSAVIRGIEEIANQQGYNVMIAQTYDSYEKEQKALDALINARVDCIIASVAKATKNFEHFKYAQSQGIPLILFDRSTTHIQSSQILIDDYNGAFKATSHLIEQGYRRIAHFTSIYEVSIYSERLRGYTDALTKHNLPVDEELIIKSDLQLEDGRQSMAQLLALPEIPDAVFSASDYGAIGAFQLAKEKGLCIPKDFGIAGFSNEPFTSFTEPGITTVEQHSINMGNQAANLFFNDLKQDVPQLRKIVLEPQLVVRGSTLRR